MIDPYSGRGASSLVIDITSINFVEKLLLKFFLDFCDYDVGLESGSLPDSAISASSSYDPVNVGPRHARLGQDVGGGAWCPQHPVGPDQGHARDWLGVNMTQPHVIRSIMTQGRWVTNYRKLHKMIATISRYAQGQGQEYTMAFQVEYWREGMARFREYRDSMGRNVSCNC